MGKCLKHDCRYRAEVGDYGCDYAAQTGRTRLGQLYRSYGFDRFSMAAAYYADPIRCPFYEEKEPEHEENTDNGGEESGFG